MPLTKADHQRIWEEVKANHAKLDGCPGPHDFQPCESIRGTAVPRRYRCAICGGEVDTINRRWYQRGLDHARKSAEKL